ncbi:3-isopropylmalate dehydratase [Chloroflexi bacterium TSY]|nr:3-isopropylmalate dehydratase [Chloroflexi bacterium TSY]
MILRGTAWKYGDDVNTDVIFPGKYTYTLRERDEIARHALEDLDPSFAEAVQPGDVVVAGRNWGCGSSREQAATCLVYNGVGAVIAESFGRIFYRNAINSGLLAIAAPSAAKAIESGERVTISLENQLIRCAAGEYTFPAFSPTILGIVQAGGLVAYTKRKLTGQV